VTHVDAPLISPRFPIRVLAPNPGPFTLEGTNTWIVGRERTIVIDPGPDDPAHIEEVRRSAGVVAQIVVTHRHPDHAPGAVRLAEATGAPVREFDPSSGAQPLRDGDVLSGDGIELTAVHTPGHTADHVVLFHAEGGWLFTGDAVLGRGTSVIDPPEGDLTDYLHSLRRMRSLRPRVICPGHGPVVWEADAKLAEYIEHRADRERQVIEALNAAGSASPAELVPAIYHGYPTEIHAAAARSVLAHLIALERAGRVTRVAPDPDRFAPVPADAGEDDGDPAHRGPPTTAPRRRRPRVTASPEATADRPSSPDDGSESPPTSEGPKTV
jgi:glyoxylase-like metal-dependent hydrolase (beta-lactamase superfamily II)